MSKDILKLVEELREKLRLLPKDTLDKANLRDSTNLEKITTSITNFNRKFEDFEKNLDTMSSTIKNVLSVLNENDGEGKPLSYNFKGKKPTHFYIDGKKFEVNAWIQFYSETLKYLYKKDKSIITKLLKNKFCYKGKVALFSNTRKVYAIGKKIADNIYVEGDLSAVHITRRISCMLTFYSMSQDNIIIYIKE